MHYIFINIKIANYELSAILMHMTEIYSRYQWNFKDTRKLWNTAWQRLIEEHDKMNPEDLTQLISAVYQMKEIFLDESDIILADQAVLNRLWEFSFTQLKRILKAIMIRYHSLFYDQKVVDAIIKRISESTYWISSDDLKDLMGINLKQYITVLLFIILPL